MLLNQVDVVNQFRIYSTEGIFVLPLELDEGQKTIFDHIAEALPHGLFFELLENIEFLFQQEVDLFRQGENDNDNSRGVARFRGSLVEHLAESNKLQTLMGNDNKYLVANYLVADLKNLAQSV